jgi:hypothetical protein
VTGSAERWGRAPGTSRTQLERRRRRRGRLGGGAWGSGASAAPMAARRCSGCPRSRGGGTGCERTGGAEVSAGECMPLAESYSRLATAIQLEYWGLSFP